MTKHYYHLEIQALLEKLVQDSDFEFYDAMKAIIEKKYFDCLVFDSTLQESYDWLKALITLF